jgi:cytoskeletal protein CcmA (bactofilin family)
MKKIILFFLMLIFMLSSVGALQIKGGDDVVIKEQINENLVVAGSSVSVEGPVNGDVMAAGGEVRIESVVNGDILAAGGTVYVKNNVTGDVRAAGGQIEIDGNVNGDVMATGGTIRIKTLNPVGGDVLVSGGKITLNSNVKGDARLSGGDVKIDGVIEGNAIIEGENIVLSDGAFIKGDLNYSSATEPVLKKEQVNGSIFKKDVDIKKRAPTYVASLGWKIYTSLALLLIAIVLVWVMPAMSLRLANNIRHEFWKSLLLGLVALVVTPVAAILIGITLIGLPIAIVIVMLFVIAVYISKIFAALWVGKLFFRKPHRTLFGNVVLPVIIGIVIYAILVSIPYAGWLVRILGMLLGLGAMTIAIFNLEKKRRQR